MTDKQSEVTKQVEELLREHFDGYVLTLHCQDVDDEGASETTVLWGGGIMLAHGLAEYAKHKISIRAWSEDDEKESRENL